MDLSTWICSGSARLNLGSSPESVPDLTQTSPERAGRRLRKALTCNLMILSTGEQLVKVRSTSRC